MTSADKYRISVIVPSEATDQQVAAVNSRKTREFGDELDAREVELFKLVKHGTAEEVEEFLTANTDGLDINKKDAEFHTVLQIAVFRGSLAIVKLLVAAGCRDPYALELAGALRFNDILQHLIANSPPDSRLASIQEETEALSSPDAFGHDYRDGVRGTPREVHHGDVPGNAGNQGAGVLYAVRRFTRSRQKKLTPQKRAVKETLQLAVSAFSEGVVKSEAPEQEIRRMLKAAIDADDYKETKNLVDILHTRLPNSRALSLHCLCPECRKTAYEIRQNVLQEASDRLDVCHILSSATYILITALDPIWTALEWTKHLQSMAYWHAENREEFLQLAQRSSKLAVDLLATCKNDEDVELLFEVSHEAEKRRFAIVDSSLKYKRLHDAVGLLQKQFVTHPSCQHVVTKLWLGSYYNRWGKWSTFRRMWHILWQVLFMPFIFFLIMFKVKFAKSCLKAPLNRFIYAATSYSFFLVTVVANQYVDRARNWPTPSVDGYDFVIGFWVAGHACKILTDFVTQRHFSYSRLWWSTYDALMMAFFIAGAVTFILGSGSKIGQIANWRVALLSQGFYAIAMTLACLRVLQWLHLSSTLGPLVISFSRMTVVLRRLFVIFSIVVLSFSIGIYTIYKNFRTDPPDDDDDDKDDTFFASYLKTLKILFWAIFGKGEGNYASIPEQYHYFVRNLNITTEFQESFTILVGYTLWSFFHIAVVIVLLNMLIAVMTHYYQIIQDNGDTEWKFARTKLRMYYIEKNNRFPPPFNIVAMIFRLAKYLLMSWRGVKDDETDAKEKNAKSRIKHQEIVKDLIEKYLHERDLTKSREQRQRD